MRKRLRRLYQSIIPATIEGRLRWGGILLVLIPSLLIILAFSVYEVTSERQQAMNRLEEIVGLRRQMITLWAQNKGVKIKTLAGNSNVHKFDKAAMAIDLQAALDADDKFHNIIFVNKDGNTELDLKRPAGINLNHTSYFKRAANGQPTVAELTFGESSGKAGLIFAVPVIGFDGQFQGAIVGIMPLEAIESIMGGMAFGKTGDTYLVDKQGIRFTLPRLAREGKIEPSETAGYLKPVDNIVTQRVLAGASGIEPHKNCQDNRVLCVYQPINELGWTIIGEIDENEVLDPVYAEIMNMIIVFLGIIIAAIPLTLVVARTITKPLGYLLAASESMKSRDYSYRVDSRSIVMAPHELKQLCCTFNQMAATIADHQEHLEDKIKKRTFALQNAIKKLHSQILARRQIELSLRRGEEKYRALFDKATDAIFVCESTGDHLPGRFIEVNTKACDLLGYTRDELLELTPLDIDAKMKNYHPSTWMIENRQGIMLETIHRKKSGETFPVEMNVHQIMLHGMPVYLTIARDISVRRKMEQEMSRFERLNLVGEMAASIGHEVRNPMTTVRGFLQMLGRRNENSPNAEYFALMIEELDRANGIISEFLSLAKNKPVDLKIGSLNTIITTLHPLLKADAIIANKEVCVELGDIAELYLDEKEIRQLILNLVRNGLEAMPPQTKLVIRTYPEGDEVVLAVKDQGSGIEPEILEKLGTPFFTTKEKGTGLGLAVCYSIANRHNATIVPETSPQGTTFYVRFQTKK